MTVHPKVISATAVSALLGIAFWLLQAYAHTTLPPEVQGEIFTVAVFLAGYFTSSPTASANATSSPPAA
jgi:heme/copper-type cytochrome/quinol oxidase subunit 3